MIPRIPRRSSAPAAEHGARFDRAAIVTTAILQIVCNALTAWLNGDHTAVAGVRAAIASLLRDEFNDVALTTLNENRREDG